MVDNDEIVTCELGQILYKEYIEWCNSYKSSRYIDALRSRKPTV